MLKCFPFFVKGMARNLLCKAEIRRHHPAACKSHSSYWTRRVSTRSLTFQCSLVCLLVYFLKVNFQKYPEGCSSAKYRGAENKFCQITVFILIKSDITILEYWFTLGRVIRKAKHRGKKYANNFYLKIICNLSLTCLPCMLKEYFHLRHSIYHKYTINV